VKSGAPREPVVYVNFEDVKLAGVRPEHFGAFVNTMFELAKPHDEIFYFSYTPLWRLLKVEKAYIFSVFLYVRERLVGEKFENLGLLLNVGLWPCYNGYWCYSLPVAKRPSSRAN